MRLSEAIRLGAMLKPQATGDLLTDDGLATCAIGAALDAAGMLTDAIDDGTPALFEWPLLKMSPPPCPACEWAHDSDDLYDCITTLNDLHGWTREQIADWVESIERSLEGAPEPVPVAAQAAETRA